MKPTITMTTMTKSAYNNWLNSFIGSDQTVYELPSNWAPFLLDGSKGDLTRKQIREIECFLQNEASQFGAHCLSCVSFVKPPGIRGKSFTSFVFDII
jgi:hypothetical protein